MNSLRLLCVCALVLSGAARASETSEDRCLAHVAQALDAFTTGHFADSAALFGGQAKRLHDAENLRLVRTAIEQRAGVFTNRTSPRWVAVGARRYVFTTLSFADKSMDAIDACDVDGAIDLFEWAASSDAARRIAADRPRAYANGVRELPLTVASPDGPLPATLTLPRGTGPFPAVVLVAGSGPNDRDETIGPNKPFRDLALGLAEAGVASLRYDKRVRAYPAQAGLNDALTIDDEVTVDALTAMQTLSVRSEVDPRRLFILGHSLGAFVTPRIAQRRDDLAGVVLMAAPGEPLLDTLRRQVLATADRGEATATAVADQVRSIDAEQAMLGRMNEGHAPAGSFMGAPHGYWLSIRDEDPLARLQASALPALVIQAGADIQVTTVHSFVRWQQALHDTPDVRLVEYPGLTHIFTAAGTPPSPADYFRPGHMSAVVIRDVATWIKEQAPIPGLR